MNNLDNKTVSNSLMAIRDWINYKNNNTHIKSRARVYVILCLYCNKNMVVKLIGSTLFFKFLVKLAKKM